MLNISQLCVVCSSFNKNLKWVQVGIISSLAKEVERTELEILQLRLVSSVRQKKTENIIRNYKASSEVCPSMNRQCNRNSSYNRVMNAI